MEFILLKENLVKALNVVNRALSIKPQLPILSSILFKAKNNQLTFSTTNLELGIVYTIPAKIEKEGELAIPGKLLQEFVSNLGADKVNFTLDGSQLKVTSGKTKASFAIASPTDFPPFPTISQNKKTLSLEKLKDAVMRVYFAASTDETRPVLTGIKTVVKEGKISLFATDGYRLSMESVEIADKKEDFHIILPAQSLVEVIRIAADIDAEKVEFSIIENKNQVVFVFPNVVLFTRLIDGEFPTVEKIIPVSFKTKATIEKDVFSQTVKTASLFARGAANIVKIKITKDGLLISANTPQVGSDEDFVDAKVEGEEVEIAFNYRFLLDLLSHFPDKEIILESSGALNPGVFKAPSAPSFLHLIMPVRVQG